MRLIVAMSALLVLAGATPSMARDYAFCARTITNPDFGDCSFTTYAQCMATVSGQAGDCIRNPRTAYGAYGGRRASGWRNDNRWNNQYDNGWNNQWNNRR